MNAMVEHLTPSYMAPRDLQAANEYKFCRQHLDKFILNAIQEDAAIEAKVKQGVEYLQQWLAGEYYESKNRRLRQLQIRGMDLTAMVRSIFTGIAYCLRPETFVSVSSQMAGRLNFDDKVDSITTMAEILAVLCYTDAFHIFKENEQSTMMVVSAIPLPANLLDAIDRSLYTPPMVCAPKLVTSNYRSPYLTFNECQVLGKGNGHEGDLCLDVINTQNQIPLSLDAEFLAAVEETPNKPVASLEQKQQWDHFRLQSRKVYDMLIRQGNHFWLTNKVDKRGRLYAQGYHVTSQGSSYKKAMLELADQEVVNGVPGLST